jgi:hypothetical protein
MVFPISESAVKRGGSGQPNLRHPPPTSQFNAGIGGRAF